MTGRPGITAGYAWAIGFCAAAGALGSHWWLAGAAGAVAAALVRARLERRGRPS
jgi:hypothetical protein